MTRTFLWTLLLLWLSSAIWLPALLWGLCRREDRAAAKRLSAQLDARGVAAAPVRTSNYLRTGP